MYKDVGVVSFPESHGHVMVNMMPFIFGDKSSLPADLRRYAPMIEQCTSLTPGKVAYLTVHESFVTAGTSQRRPGIHTEGTNGVKWGGGSWGGTKGGLYFASNDGSTRVWNEMVPEFEVNDQGALLVPARTSGVQMKPGHLYWLTDRTPHEAMKVSEDTHRQFFRLVSDEVSVWWAKHNTPNPLGVQPDCKILTESKFQ